MNPLNNWEQYFIFRSIHLYCDITLEISQPLLDLLSKYLVSEWEM